MCIVVYSVCIVVYSVCIVVYIVCILCVIAIGVCTTGLVSIQTTPPGSCLPSGTDSTRDITCPSSFLPSLLSQLERYRTGYDNS